jgi:hypothetical protein
LPTVGSGTGQITLTGGLASADTRQFLGSAVQITTGRPQVDTATMAAAVATQITTSQNNSIIDDSALASAAALTAQITFRQAIGLMSAALFGRTTAAGNTFLTPDNAKTRIVGASAANERTSITLTPSG